MSIKVMFTDAAEKTIIAYFSGPQDPKYYDNLGAVESDDPRWKDFYDLQPALVQDVLPTTI